MTNATTETVLGRVDAVAAIVLAGALLVLGLAPRSCPARAVAAWP